MRIFKRLATMAAGVAIAATGLSAGVVASATPAHAEDCSNVIFMTDGYTNGTTGNSFAGVPNKAGYHKELITYDGTIFGVVQPHTLDWTLAHAVPQVINRAKAFHAACPAAHITFLGYSFGALIAGNATEYFAGSSDIPHNQINAVLYGDPRRSIHSLGIEGPAGGVLTVIPSLPGITATGSRNFRDIPVSSTCDENDFICNSANPITNLQAFIAEVNGYLNGGAHTRYKFNPWQDSAPGIHFIKAVGPQPYGAPLPLPIGMPRDIANSDPTGIYKGLIGLLNNAVNAADWAGILNRFGLPGDQLIHALIVWSEQSHTQI